MDVSYISVPSVRFFVKSLGTDERPVGGRLNMRGKLTGHPSQLQTVTMGV